MAVDDNILIIQQGWCQTFDDIDFLSCELMPCASLEENALLRIALYLSVFDRLRNKESLFFDIEKPSVLGIQQIMSILCAPRIGAIIFREHPHVSFLESLIGLAWTAIAGFAGIF